MLVVRVEMWPLGDPKRARTLSMASFTLVGAQPVFRPGQTTHTDDGSVCLHISAEACGREHQVGRVERTHEVRLLKNSQFIQGGHERFEDPAVLLDPRGRDIWKAGTVTGHNTGGSGRDARGAWDLIGGGLGAVLGARLDGYRRLK